MANHNSNNGRNPLDASRVRQAARELLAAVAEEIDANLLSPKAYERTLREFDSPTGLPGSTSSRE